MQIAVTEVAFSRCKSPTRMPFRFGAVTLHEAELLTCRVGVRDANGRTAHGWSGDLLVPRWFRKDTDATPTEDAQELYAAAVAAARCYGSQSMASAFALWRSVWRHRVEPVPSEQPDLLVRGFGVAIVERAVLDAVCRLAGMPFAQALRADLFGFRPGEVHADLTDWNWMRDLPPPSRHVTVRHTVGMLDVLRPRDLAPEDRLDDGLPQTLADDIDEYGLSWFKIKIGAGPARDRRRLLDLAAFFAERDLAPGFSLDGNEQYEDIAQLAELLEGVAAETRGREFLSRLAWIEQPLARVVTFDRGRHRGLDRVVRFAPLILDEADATPQSFRRALELGYRGVSVKNCKGVFRALCNFGVCRRAEDRFQTGEDLTNVGVLPLQQDLVTASALGLPHVERNGHHYFRGLDHLDSGVAARAERAHGDLYRTLADGTVAVRIVGGRMAIGSLLDAVGYGTALGELADDLHVVVG
ncbi:MAG TPA: hypothetical protein ENI87_00880 [bacterium]|nr:hypothetical protein [bacterium]